MNDILRQSTRADRLDPYYPIARPLDQHDNRVARAAESLEGGVAAFRWDVIVPFG